MNYRRLGKTGLKVSEVSLGTWQVGGRWGSDFSDAHAEAILNAAIDGGVTFIDTADVYSDGMSEQAVGRVVRSRSEAVAVGTKCGRKVRPHVSEGYTPEVLRGFVEDSLRRTGLERLDLVQLHCPPTQVFYRPEVFELFDRLEDEGKIANLGVSIEKVEEGLKAMEYPNVCSIQVIYNMFRHRPAESLFPEAVARDVGIIVRVPLASGLLTGKFGADSSFAPGDHRNFNRDGSAFDKGETFSGVDYQTALTAVDRIAAMLDRSMPMAQAAIRWILDHPAVSTVIPGASRPEQVAPNLAASEATPLSTELHYQIQDLYDELIAPEVHQRW